jgi:hypothetical protein
MLDLDNLWENYKQTSLSVAGFLLRFFLKKYKIALPTGTPQKAGFFAGVSQDTSRKYGGT